MSNRSPARGTVVRLAILEGYKVRWSRETVARDVVQNFFDEASDFDHVSIEIDRKAKRVRVAGPSEFALEYLRYLGATTKNAPSRRSAGGFGEGFKVCALVLLRDYGVRIVAGSRGWEIEPYFAEVKLGRELRYRVRRGGDLRERRGSFVELHGVDGRLASAFEGAKELFRHPGNPRLKNPFFVDDATGVGVYLAADGAKGDLFYRRQHRGVLRFSHGSALTFAFDDRLEPLDADRDRRDLRAALPLVEAVVARLPDDVVLRLLKHLRRYWARGGRVLGTIVRACAARGLKASFPRRWLARSPTSDSRNDYAERIGFHLGIPALATAGMATVEAHVPATQEKRPPRPEEQARIEVAADAYLALVGRRPIQKKLVVTETSARDVLQMKRILDASHLAAPFETGFAEVLGALCVGSYAARRNDADRLTALLEAAMRRPDVLEAARARWDDPKRAPTHALAPEDLEDPLEDLPARLSRAIGVVVYAPPGFPLAHRLGEHVDAIAKRMGLVAWVIHAPLVGEEAAIRCQARGVPALWIGRRPIAPGGARVGYRLNVYEGGTLLPPEDVVADALRRFAPREGQRRPTYGGPSRARCARAYRRYLARHDPAKLRRLAWKDAFEEPEGVAGLSWEESRFVRKVAAAKGPPRGVAIEDFPARANAAVKNARRRVEALFASIDARLGADSSARERLLDHVRTRASKWMSRFSFDAVAEALPDYASSLVAVSGGERLPLDATCSLICLRYAEGRFDEVLDAQLAAGRSLRLPTAVIKEAVRVGEESLQRAVELAVARHDQRGEDGEPLSCSELDDALDAAFGAAEEEVDPIEHATTSAWKAAMEETGDERIAAERAMAAAEAARRAKNDDEELAE